jgi:hypothetical protein
VVSVLVLSWLCPGFVLVLSRFGCVPPEVLFGVGHVSQRGDVEVAQGNLPVTSDLNTPPLAKYALSGPETLSGVLSSSGCAGRR